MRSQTSDGSDRKMVRDISPDVEERLMDHQLKEMDRHVVNRIEHSYGRHVPQARLERAREQPVHFLHHPEYLQHLKQINAEPKERKKIVGDYSEGEAWVDQDEQGKMKTVAHERLHQLSDPLYRSIFGERLDEGTTEYLARNVTGNPQLANEWKAYSSETRLMEMLSARVGDEPIEEAYFQGDWVGFKATVDKQLGDGALAEISSLAEQGKYAEAREVIKGK
jgi:hypothetical protein